jgi:hypothetical protein
MLRHVWRRETSGDKRVGNSSAMRVDYLAAVNTRRAASNQWQQAEDSGSPKYGAHAQKS